MLHNLIGKMTYWSNTPRNLLLGAQHQASRTRRPTCLAGSAWPWIAKAITAALGDASAVPATGWIPPSIPGYAAITHDFLKPTAQVAQAAVLLANAGPRRRGGPAGDPQIQVTPSGQNLAVANAVKTEWCAIGVNATVAQIPLRRLLGLDAE